MVDPGTLPTDGEAGAGSPGPVLFPTFDSQLDFLDTGDGERQGGKGLSSHRLYMPLAMTPKPLHGGGKVIGGMEWRSHTQLPWRQFPSPLLMWGWPTRILSLHQAPEYSKLHVYPLLKQASLLRPTADQIVLENSCLLEQESSQKD